MSHQGRFDGISVDQFQAKFSGVFDLDDYDAMHQGLDGEVMFVVIAKVKGATITETPVGDVKRVNNLAVKQVAVVRTQSDREELADMLHLDLPLTLELTSSAPAAVATTAVLEVGPPTASSPREDDEIEQVPVASTMKVMGSKDPLLAGFLSEAG